MKLMIYGKGKMCYLIGDTKKLAITNVSALQHWNSDNSMVIAWFIHSLVPFIGKKYLFLPTAEDIWKAIRETYFHGENSAHIFELKTRL